MVQGLSSMVAAYAGGFFSLGLVGRLVGERPSGRKLPGGCDRYY